MLNSNDNHRQNNNNVRRMGFSVPGHGTPLLGCDWTDFLFLGTYRGDISPPLCAGSILGEPALCRNHPWKHREESVRTCVALEIDQGFILDCLNYMPGNIINVLLVYLLASLSIQLGQSSPCVSRLNAQKNIIITIKKYYIILLLAELVLLKK